MRYVAVAGTHDVDGRHEDTDAWWHPASPFAKFLRAYGWRPALDEPYVWSGAVDGDVWRPFSRRFSDWRAAAHSLVYYIANARREIQGEPLCVIAHSHGGNLASIALSHEGCDVNAFCTICTPVRKDLDLDYWDAAHNATTWLHVADPAFWANKYQWMGSVFDGGIGWHWDMPYATTNDIAKGCDLGHSGALKDPKLWPLWVTRGWLQVLAGETPGNVAHSPIPAAWAPSLPGEPQ